MTTFNSNPFDGNFGGLSSGSIDNFFNDDSGLALQGRISGSGFTRGTQQTLRGRTNDLLNQFQGALSAQLMNTGNPRFNSLDFFTPDFLRDEAARVSPAERGFFSGQFAPGARHLFNF